LLTPALVLFMDSLFVPLFSIQKVRQVRCEASKILEHLNKDKVPIVVIVTTYLLSFTAAFVQSQPDVFCDPVTEVGAHGVYFLHLSLSHQSNLPSLPINRHKPYPLDGHCSRSASTASVSSIQIHHSAIILSNQGMGIPSLNLQMETQCWPWQIETQAIPHQLPM